MEEFEEVESGEMEGLASRSSELVGIECSVASTKISKYVDQKMKMAHYGV